MLCVVLLAVASVPHAQEIRQFWLSPVEGSGTEDDPYHSRCLRMPGAGNIDLRPDVDAFLCASNDLPADMTGVEQIGASYKSALGGKKGALNAKFKKSLSANTVEDLIIEVVSPKLTAGKDGKLKIYLGGSKPIYQQTAWVPFRDGGLVADLSNAAMGLVEPTLAWAATISESFTATDGDLDGCCTSVWTEFFGTEWTIVSNQAVGSGNTTGSLAAARNTVNSFATADHTATVTAVSLVTGNAADGTNTSCAVLIRKGSNTTQTFYRTTTIVRDSGELNETLLQKTVTGTTTTLASDTTDWTANDTITVSAVGSTISGQLSAGTLMTVTDTEITGGTNYGIRYFSDYTTGSPSCTLDNLTGSDVSSRIRGGSRWLP